MRRVCIGCQIAIVLIGATSCGSSSPPGPPQGPGRIAGDVVFRQPVIELRNDSPHQTAPDAVSQLVASAGIELRTPLIDGAVRSLASERWFAGMVNDYYNMTLTYSGAGVYRMPFDFDDIPLGQYTLGFTHSTGGDWGMISETIFDTQQSVGVDKQQLELLGVEHPISGNGSAAGTSISGRLLVSGNLINYVPAPSIRKRGESPALPYLENDQPQPIWSELVLSSEPALYGRYFFTLRDIEPGIYDLARWHSVPGQFEDLYWTDEEDAADNSQMHTLRVDATGGPVNGAVAYAFRAWAGDFPADSAQELPQSELGIIEVTLTLPPVFDLTTDTVLVAQSTTGELGRNHVAFNYVSPLHFDVSGLAHYRLKYLKAGTYNVSLRQLGPTNLDPVTTLATYAEPVNLPSDTPYPDFNWDGDEVPYAHIEFAVE